MALDPGIRDLLQAIEEALAQQPAADDRAQLNELASRADLVRQAVKRALEDEPPATTATWVRVHAGLPPGSRAEPRHAPHKYRNKDRQRASAPTSGRGCRW
jgi:hypothetical protein